jgi:hypothetical protein
MTTAEEAVAHLQTRYDNALARMAAKPVLREDEDYLEFVADIERQLDAAKRLVASNKRQRAQSRPDRDDARMHAEAFVRILAEVGGPKQLRVWQGSSADARIYFPGDLGYVTVSREGTVRDMARGGQTLAVTALYPAWRRAYREALRLHTQAREEALAQSDDE